MTQTTIFDTKLENLLELSNEDGELMNGEAFASVSLNPSVSWTKFILTDDQPNGNHVRVPQEEFQNLIKTGIYMPFKMASGQINEGHDESYPLGVIAQLTQSGNQIIALAALWRKEREKDIEYLKSCIAEKIPVNVSWEILHEDSREEEDGTIALIGTSLRGVAVVGRPAYAGRTPVLQVASKQEESNSEENKLDELEQIKQKVADLESDLASKLAELTEKNTRLSELETEVVSLREFKETVEKKEQDSAKLDSVKELFKKANIDKPQAYFDENREKFLAASMSDIEFLVQELVAFSAQKSASLEDKTSSEPIPAIVGSGDKEISIKDLAEELRKNS